MATFDVQLRTDRWSLCFTGAGIVDAKGRAIGLRIGTAKPADSDRTARIVLGGNSDGDDNRYAYDGVETVYARLEAGDLPHTVVCVQDGTASAPRAPYLPDIALATDADTTLTGAAGALFAQLDAQNACTVTAVTGGTVGSPIALAGGGALTINANGSYTFDPTGDFDALKGDATAATTPVTITVTDGGNSLTTTAALRITVSGVNDGPAAVNDTATTPNTAASLVVNVLTNDTHPQGEPLTLVKIGGRAFAGGLEIPLASGATIEPRGDGTITYRPKGRAAGAEAIAYTVADRFGAEASATLTVTVTA